jgi:hypothetical protein
MLVARKAQLTAKRQELKLSAGAIFGPHTRKNQKLYLAWAAVCRRFEERDAEDGLPSSALYEAARAELMRLNPVTFRSYLVRFRDEGLLIRVGARWHLVAVNLGAAGHCISQFEARRQ